VRTVPVVCRWQQTRAGQRHVGRRCSRCGRFRGFFPQVESYVSEADANLTPTVLLDVLIRLEDLGIELESDGCDVSFLHPGDYWRVPQDLHLLIAECKHDLARMIGPTPTSAPATETIPERDHVPPDHRTDPQRYGS
jgi:hypothetical protein